MQHFVSVWNNLVRKYALEPKDRKRVMGKAGMINLGTAFSLVLILSISLNLKAGDWGVGIAGGSLPHYMGSAEHYQKTLAFPFMIDEDSFKEETFYFRMGGHFNLPVSGARLTAAKPHNFDSDNEVAVTDENYSRRGMGYLPPAIYLGAEVGIAIGDLKLSLTAAPGVQLGNDWGSAGLIQKAELEWRLFKEASKSSMRCLCLKYSLLYSNETYNELYYSVSAEDALSDRAVYDASKSGLLGSVVEINYIQSFGSLGVMGFVNLQNMSQSIVKDSPLVERKTGGAAGLAVFFLF